MPNRVLTVDEQIDIELALRIYMDSVSDSTLPYYKEAVKRIEKLLKDLKSNRLAVIGVY